MAPGGRGFQLDLAEPGHADLGHAQARLAAAGAFYAGVDQAVAAVRPPDLDAQPVGIGDQPLHQRRG